MAATETSLEQLKSFLNELFQFESQDLDFGVYKILHYKRKEIANFIDNLLVEKVQEQLQTLSEDETEQVRKQLAELKKSPAITRWLEAVEKQDETRLSIYEEDYKAQIDDYQELKAKAEQASVSVETENQIYNHLTLFFSRYYDKGDFISKRRFGKNEKYVVPYNGEETHFHWANHDQYYIKSSETFNHYAFKVPTMDGTLVVNFKLHDAQLEQGNVKGDEKNFFLLADKSPELKEKDDKELNFVLANKKPDVSEKEVTIYFEYRPLGDGEKGKIKGSNKQDSLDEIAFDVLKKEFGKDPVFANLWKEAEGKPLLLKKLRHYTRKNKHDFFIHKNLKGFLERELDFYIKSELVDVDDLYVTDTDTHFNRLRHNLKTIKVFKSIAETIIEFVSQIEGFQKKLWEKKKFVVGTEWVITVDRLIEYIGIEEATSILEEVIENEQQVEEWREFFGKDLIPGSKINIDHLKADLHAWKKVAIDTKYFGPEFTSKLLSRLSEHINLETAYDGLVLKSENYQGLHLFSSKYEGQIRCIYIDPPYNTGNDGFNYKDSYKDSSWLSLINDRFELASSLVKTNGVSLFSIDDIEAGSLKNLLENRFGKEGFLGVFVWKRRITSSLSQSWLSTDHEYVFVYTKEPSTVHILGEDKDKSKYKYDDGDGRLYASMPLTVGMNKRQRPNQWYPLINPKTGTEYYPTENRVWCYYPPTMEQKIEEKRIIWPEDRPNSKMTTPRLKSYIDEAQRDKKPVSTWINERKKAESDCISFELESGRNEEGTKWLNQLFGLSEAVYPKPISLIEELGNQFTLEEDYILDYFAGSGTTFHATQILNKTNTKRKCILIEQGDYVDHLVIPRIKKIAYSYDWKGGKPKDRSMNGLGVFFKYQRLEQYEESLENIAFNAPENAIQKALEFAQYIPKYFLEFETKGSQTLVNTAAMKDPWGYKLKVWDGFTYDTEQAVDLVETFNYLIGLHMQKCITKEVDGNKYQFIIGNNNVNKQIAVVWRSVKDWELKDYEADAKTLKEELKAFTYDKLYINDQAHLDDYQPIEEVFKNKMLS